MDSPVITPKKNLEFGLVVVMLGVLVTLVLAIMLAPVSGGIDDRIVKSSDSTSITLSEAMDYRGQVMSYRKEILAVIITAFGAWVGAGAAYFFGRENLRVATEGLLAMREKSPRDRLREMAVRSIPPRCIGWTVQQQTSMTEVGEKVKENTSIWFVPVVDKDGALDTVLHEELVWRYLASQPTPPPASTIKEVIEKAKTDIRQRNFVDIYVAVSLQSTVAEAEELMRSKGVYLAVVIDDKRRPTHFITTGDVRSALMREPVAMPTPAPAR
jgi:CBS domain-containing protein